MIFHAFFRINHRIFVKSFIMIKYSRSVLMYFVSTSFNLKNINITVLKLFLKIVVICVFDVIFRSWNKHFFVIFWLTFVEKWNWKFWFVVFIAFSLMFFLTWSNDFCCFVFHMNFSLSFSIYCRLIIDAFDFNDRIIRVRFWSHFFMSDFDFTLPNSADIFIIYVFFIFSTCSARHKINCRKKRVSHKNPFNCARLTEMSQFSIFVRCLTEGLILFAFSLKSIMFKFSMKACLFRKLKYMNPKIILKKYLTCRKSCNSSKFTAAHAWSSANEIIATFSWFFMMIDSTFFFFVESRNPKTKFVNCA